jgi:hypothetical protein
VGQAPVPEPGGCPTWPVREFPLVNAQYEGRWHYVARRDYNIAKERGTTCVSLCGRTIRPVTVHDLNDLTACVNCRRSVRT